MYPGTASGQPFPCYVCDYVGQGWWECKAITSGIGQKQCHAGYQFCELSGPVCADPERVSPAGTLATLDSVNEREVRYNEAVSINPALDYREHMALREDVPDRFESTLDCHGAVVQRSYSKATVLRIRLATNRLTI